MTFLSQYLWLEVMVISCCATACIFSLMVLCSAVNWALSVSDRSMELITIIGASIGVAVLGYSFFIACRQVLEAILVFRGIKKYK